MNKLYKVFLILALPILLASVLNSFALDTNKRTGSIIDSSGIVEIKTDGNTPWSTVNINQVFTEGAAIKTKANSWVFINIDGQTKSATVRLSENSEMLMTILSENKQEGIRNTLLDLSLGEATITVTKAQSSRSKFEVKTPTSIIDVKGAKFSVSVKAEE